MQNVNTLTAPLGELRLLRIAEVSRLVGLCESRIRQLEHTGHFPKRVAIGANSSGFFEGDVRRWLAERAARGALRLQGAVTEAQATRKRKPAKRGARV